MMASYQNIIYEKKGRIAYITLNRPQVLNAMSQGLLDDLMDGFRQFDLDEEAWVCILTGAGDRAFSAGVDVGDFGAQTPVERQINALKRPHGFLGLAVNWKPVIAAVHGYCYGFGIILAAECDLVVAAENALFSIRELKRGLPGGSIMAQLLQWMPSKVAVEMALTGDPITAQDGFRLGLVNQVVPREQLMAAAERMAERIMDAAPLAVRGSVRIARLRSPLWQQAQLHDAALGLDTTEDFQEAVRSFAEKRPPVWRAR